MTGTRRIAALVAVLLCAVSAQAQIVFELASQNLAAPPAAVCVTGPFNQWSTTDNPLTLQAGVWRAAVKLPDGRHYYKFKLRDAAGQWQPMADPANPFKALRANRDWCSFVDVAGGRRVDLYDGLETFRWPPDLPAAQRLDNGAVLRPETIFHQLPAKAWRMPAKPMPGTVYVKGDFGDGIFSRFTLALCSDGVWRAHVPLRRPFSYLIYVDDNPLKDLTNDFQVMVLRLNAGLPKTAFGPPPLGSRVRDGKGGTFSYREQFHPTSPTLAPVRSDLRAGDRTVLDEVTSHALSADYGRAVALARKVREINAAASGSTSPLVLEAALAEAHVHKRWWKVPEAVRCWEAILQAERDSTATREAANELASYYLYTERDHEKTRVFCDRAMAFLSPSSPEFVQLLTKYTMTLLSEKRYDDVIRTVDGASLKLYKVAQNPLKPALADFLLIKAYAQAYKGDWDGTRATCEQVLTICPVSAQGTRTMARVFNDFARQRRIDNSRFLLDLEVLR